MLCIFVALDVVPALKSILAVSLTISFSLGISFIFLITPALVNTEFGVWIVPPASEEVKLPLVGWFKVTKLSLSL